MQSQMPSISEFISGGYFLAKYLERPECMSADLLPARILSASSCISEIPDAWAVKWANYKDNDRRVAAAKFGIPTEGLPRLLDWVTSRLDSEQIGWPVVFYSLDTAREFAKEFIPNNDEVALIGI